MKLCATLLLGVAVTTVYALHSDDFNAMAMNANNDEGDHDNIADAAFKELDVDKDGVLSNFELDAALEVLKGNFSQNETDRNRSSFVVPAELVDLHSKLKQIANQKKGVDARTMKKTIRERLLKRRGDDSMVEVSALKTSLGGKWSPPPRPTPPAPVHCLVSGWSGFSACSASTDQCGTNKGWKYRSRTVTRTPRHGGNGCPGLLDWLTCDIPCPSTHCGAFQIADGAGGCKCENVRKDWNELNGAEKAVYFEAVKKTYDSGGLQAMAEVHAAQWGFAHGAQTFLPWHRKFLLEWEELLRRAQGVEGASCVSLPYWDWAEERQACSNNGCDLASLYLESGGQGAGSGWQGCVTDGPFKDFRFDGDCLKRGTDVPDVSEVYSAAQMAALMALTPYSSFRSRLEGYHGRVHMTVGGNMGSATSPQDPIFYSHHAFIDKMWAKYQTCHSQSSYCKTSGSGANYESHVGTYKNKNGDPESITVSCDTEMPFGVLGDYYGTCGGVVAGFDCNTQLKVRDHFTMTRSDGSTYTYGTDEFHDLFGQSHHTCPSLLQSKDWSHEGSLLTLTSSVRTRSKWSTEKNAENIDPADMDQIAKVEAAFDSGGVTAMLEEDCKYHPDGHISEVDKCWAISVWGIDPAELQPCHPGHEGHQIEPPHITDFPDLKAVIQECVDKDMST